MVLAGPFARWPLALPDAPLGFLLIVSAANIDFFTYKETKQNTESSANHRYNDNPRINLLKFKELKTLKSISHLSDEY